ncbi:MAG TPA: glycosyltransferase family 9 protein [Candidatus Andersenbacteria bacterium]|nr:MAG: hypothetical protein A2854_02025 [Parcubacteria group bacterium RIFCSPHIGHO2_01_FULL_56_18]HLD25648.1 glycosyltransferase family 9 protein [Candidatus Andersenbacteria bacterium]
MPNDKAPRILLLSLSGIGNFLMHTPVFAALKKSWPQSHLTAWVAPRLPQALAESNPHIDRVIIAPHQRPLLEHLRHADHLFRQKFTIGLVLYPGQRIKSAVYLYAAGIRQRVGHEYLLGKNPRSTFLLTHAVGEKENVHDIEQNLNLLQPLGINTELGESRYSLPLSQTHYHEADKLLATLRVPHDKPLIGLHAGSAPGFAWKRWPLENFAALARTLIEQHSAHILIFGGPDEESLKQKLSRLISSPSSVTPITSDLLTTAAIMRRCELMVSNDSGLMHLAAAAGVKTLGLFGPTDENKIGPRGSLSYTIRAAGTKAVYDVNTNFDLGNAPHATLQQLKPDVVLNEIKKLLVSAS